MLAQNRTHLFGIHRSMPEFKQEVIRLLAVSWMSQLLGNFRIKAFAFLSRVYNKGIIFFPWEVRVHFQFTFTEYIYSPKTFPAKICTGAICVPWLLFLQGFILDWCNNFLNEKIGFNLVCFLLAFFPAKLSRSIQVLQVSLEIAGVENNFCPC